MARRSTTFTNASQPPTTSQAYPSNQGNANKVGWVIALVISVIILTVLAISIGVVVFSYATQQTKTSKSTTIPSLPQIIFTSNLTASSTPLPTSAESSTPAMPTFTIHENAFCRRGPDVSFPETTGIPKGDTVEIKGVSQDGFWYYVYWKQFNVNCWVAVSTGQMNGDSQGVPVLASPDTPTPKTNPKPLPTQKTTPTLLP